MEIGRSQETIVCICVTAIAPNFPGQPKLNHDWVAGESVAAAWKRHRENMCLDKRYTSQMSFVVGVV